ncbi:MAG: hypothetical protein JNL13_13375, partial [Chitinophagaceae bacterium]|nr:hypothetical protein [Chitinophagaceae bacterium]
MTSTRLPLLYALFLCCIIPLHAGAQGENNIWAFGQKKGLDFNGGDPVLISTSISAYESCATVCDATGALLFYQGTDTGSNNCIWDKNHTIMPNGSGIKGNLYSSARQGSCIIPFPDGSGKYYLFTTSTMENIMSLGDTLTFLWCSVVDMNLRGGLGDVDPLYKNRIIDTMSSSEAIAVTRGPDCSMWLITNSPDTLVFNAYKISTTGIEVKPVVSGFPSPRYKISRDVTGMILSDLAMSPNGQLMAFSRHDYYPLLELYDFDPASGVFSNRRVLDSVYHTLQFSPEGSKLYTSWGDLLQYDLSLLPSIAAVKASKYNVNIYARRTREGPDRRVYVVWEDRLYRINKPELAGAACDFTYYTSTGKPAANGFGLPVRLAAPPSMIYSSRDTQACFAPEALIAARPGYEGYTWADGTIGRILKMKDPGLTWVRMSNGCTVHIDTIRVSEKINSQTEYKRDTALCFGSSVTLNAPAGYERYRWSNGSDSQSAVVTPKNTVVWLQSVS